MLKTALFTKPFQPFKNKYYKESELIKNFKISKINLKEQPKKKAY